MQISDCEIGGSVLGSAECDASIYSHYGAGILVYLAVPVLMCLIPAAVPRLSLAWTVAGVLLVGWFLALMSSPPFMVYGFYLPIALLAVVVAAVKSAGHLRPGRVHSGAAHQH